MTVAPPALAPAATLPWIAVAPGAPYFVTEHGDAWTPVGANEAITWPGLDGLFRRRDPARAEAYLRALAACGVTCLRLMLEYCHREHRYLERPVGRFAPHMVRLWDDLFAMCERTGLRVFVTPFDTFFTWRRWRKHPYNRANGGPCDDRATLLVCGEARRAIKARLAFATERWGASGALFAWDLWNEMHPALCAYRPGCFVDFIHDVGTYLRELELRLHGRAHPQTVSIFGPELEHSPWHTEPIFRHPDLDFATSHLYEEGTIDDPRNTVDAAVSFGRLTRYSLAEIRDARPFFDSEHGPIHSFKDRHITLPEPFDDEYFRHLQWAHLASGGAGGGMRWPNRHPHVLTAGMRAAQRALAHFLPLIDWPRFRRRNVSDDLGVSYDRLARMGCADESQAVAWLLRTDTIGADGMLRADAAPLVGVELTIPGLRPGCYRVTAWDTRAGTPAASGVARHDGGARLSVPLPPLRADLAVAVRALD